MTATILTGDAIEQLRTLPDESVHCCVTSPPYWGLRDYGTAEWKGGDAETHCQSECCNWPTNCRCECRFCKPCNHLTGRVDRTITNASSKQSTNNGSWANETRETCGKCGAKRIDSQLGLEKTPEEYVANMVQVFREVRRVLRKDGTLWLNLGDSYTSGGRETRDPGQSALHPAQPKGTRRADTPPGLKPKDLCGIPWRVAFALQSDGWWLRQDIIWAKPNPMPESVTDRCTKAHEYLFLLTKSARYFYDAEAIKERGLWAEDPRKDDGRLTYNGKRQGGNGEGQEAFVSIQPNRNKRSVWTVATAPYPEAHFATYPPDLIKPCIMAGTSAKGCCAKCGAPWERMVEATPEYQKLLDRANDRGDWYPRPGTNTPREDGTKHGKIEGGIRPEYETIGWQVTCDCEKSAQRTYGALAHVPETIPCTVLDPFAGSGTTGQVALELGRKTILIELNPKYVDLIKRRCDVTPGLALA